MIDALFNILIKIVVSVISVVIWLIKTLFANVFLRITISFFKLLDFVQDLFRKLAGLGTIYDKAGNKLGETAGGESYDAGGDLVVYLFKQKVIQNALIGMVLLAVVLLFIATFIQMARVEYTEDGAKNSKWPIITSALKALSLFFIVPITCVFGVLLSNFVLKMVDGVTAGGNSVTVSGLIFKLGAYDANVVPRSSKVISDENDNENKAVKWLQEQMDKKSETKSTTAKVVGGRLSNPEDVKAIGISGDLSYNDLADAIDDMFASRSHVTEGKLEFDYAFDDVAKVGIGEEVSYLNYFLVMHYYYQTKMNFLYMWIAIFIALSSLFNASLGMIMRLYNLVVLFIISPPVAALMPLDGGNAYKNWRQKFIGSTISAYGTIVGLNLFFQIVPIVQSINLFDPNASPGHELMNINNGFYNRLTQLLFVLVGCLMIKDISKMISSIIGAEDAMDAGAGMSKQVAEKAAKIGKVAVAGAALAAGVGAAGFAKFSAGATEGMGGTDESIIENKKANREDMTRGQQIKSKVRSFSVMSKIGAKFGEKKAGEKVAGDEIDNKASAEKSSATGGSGDKKGKTKAKANIGATDKSAVGAAKDQADAKAEGGDDGAKVTAGSTSAPSSAGQKEQLAKINKWETRAAKARRASQRGKMLAGNLATSLIASSGVGKMLNDMTGGAFKALGGKGVEQWDGAIASKTDLDEGTIAMLKKQKKNAKQLAAEDAMGDSYYAAVTSYNERMVSDQVFNGESKKFTADVAGQNVNSLINSFNNAQNRGNINEMKEILNELVESLKAIGFANAHSINADTINGVIQSPDSDIKGFDKYDDGLLSKLLDKNNGGVSVKDGSIKLNNDERIKVDATEFTTRVKEVFDNMKLQIKMTDRKESYDGLVRAITSGLNSEQKKAAGIMGFQETMSHWQGSSSTEKRDRGDLKAILSILQSKLG